MKFFHCGIHQARDLESSCEVDQVGHCEVHQAKDLESFCEVDSAALIQKLPCKVLDLEIYFHCVTFQARDLNSCCEVVLYIPRAPAKVSSNCLQHGPPWFRVQAGFVLYGPVTPYCISIHYT
jgi:hypothetical protein